MEGVSALLPHPATAALNHILRSTPLAMERLRKHAGRTAEFRVGPVLLAFTVQHAGPDANPWATAPLPLLALPAYIAAEVLLCRWVARDDSSPDRGPQPSRPAV